MRTRALRASLIAAMAIGSLALWVAIPLGWLWVARDLESTGTRFLVTGAGCVASMLGAGWLLFRLEEVYARAAGISAREPGEAAWMRGRREPGTPRPALTLLETMLVVSAVLAIVALVTWWAFFADSPNPSGPLQPL